MKASFKVIVFVVIIFGLFSIGTEVYRIFKLHVDLEEELLVIALDSIELSIDDRYRHDHISIMDKDLCEENFLMQFQDRYRLNEKLEPIGKHFIEGPVAVEKIEYVEGEFQIQGDKPVQTINPSMYIKGYIEVRPLILGFDKNIKIPFEVFAENKRVD